MGKRGVQTADLAIGLPQLADHLRAQRASYWIERYPMRRGLPLVAGPRSDRAHLA